MEENFVPPVGPNEWQLYGSCIDPNAGICDAPITLPEQFSHLGMRPHTPPKEYSSKLDPSSFGKPIAANLAISLISNAYESTKALFDGMLMDNENFSQKVTLNAVNNLLNLAYGVTFDRTVILKILSQPNCEGLRSYLCARDVPEGKHYSLVMVGVDVNGYDLNYPPANYPSVSQSHEELTDDYQTQSLSVEYGNPPGSGIALNHKQTDIDEHYYLLRCATGYKNKAAL